MTREVLKGFLQAFNDHDLDAIMGYFADDCVRKDSFWKVLG